MNGLNRFAQFNTVTKNLCTMVCALSFVVVKRGSGRKKKRLPSRGKKCELSFFCTGGGSHGEGSGGEGEKPIRLIRKEIPAAEDSLSCVSAGIVLQRREVILHHSVALGYLPSNTNHINIKALTKQNLVKPSEIENLVS